MSIYQSNKGTLYKGNSVDLLSNELMDELRGRVNLIITSPPFPLNNKKKYGNQKGCEYLEWFKSLAPIFSELLAEDGSLVIQFRLKVCKINDLQAFIFYRYINIFKKHQSSGVLFGYLRIERIRVTEFSTN